MIWNQDEGVLVTRVAATHEAHSGQPAGTKTKSLVAFPFSNHSSSTKVILSCQGYLQEKIKKQDFVPL